MMSFINWKLLGMSEHEKLYMVCDDSPGEPRTKEEIENDCRLENDPKIQAENREFEKKMKALFGY